MLTRMLPAEGLADDVRGLFGPDKRRGMRIPLSEVPLDVADERADGVERAPTHGFAGQNAEPRLHHVEPGRPGGREMKMHARMLGPPCLHGRCRMRRRVVE